MHFKYRNLALLLVQNNLIPTAMKTNTKIENVVDYLINNNMTCTDRELNEAADCFNTYLSPKEKDAARVRFEEIYELELSIF